MFWQDDDNTSNQEKDQVIDLLFNLDCRELPVNHEVALFEAICQVAPWIKDNEHIAIHNIHLAGSQNGWERPDPELGQKLILSKRTKLTIRCAHEDSERLQNDLFGKELDVDGHALTIGKAKEKSLPQLGTIFCRQIILEQDTEVDENTFLMRVADDLAARGIKITKALCGILIDIETTDGVKKARSLMLADLRKEDSVKLQQEGIGDWQHLGCGIFLPHKGIDAVKQKDDDES